MLFSSPSAREIAISDVPLDVKKRVIRAADPNNGEPGPFKSVADATKSVADATGSEHQLNV